MTPSQNPLMVSRYSKLLNSPKGPARPAPITPPHLPFLPLSPLFIPLHQTGLLCVLPAHQVQFCPRAFEWAILTPRNMLPSIPPMLTLSFPWVVNATSSGRPSLINVTPQSLVLCSALSFFKVLTTTRYCISYFSLAAYGGTYPSLEYKNSEGRD